MTKNPNSSMLLIERIYWIEKSSCGGKGWGVLLKKKVRGNLGILTSFSFSTSGH